MNYFLQAFKKIFTYQGRARRAEYGWFFLINFLVQVGVGFTAIVLLGGGKMLFATHTPSMLIHSMGITALLLNVFSLIYSVLTFFVALSLTARRLHDLGWSGWWQVSPIVCIVILCAPLLIIKHPSPDLIQFLSFGTLIIVGAGWLVIQLILLLKDGQKYPNKYGESPKYPTSTSTYQH